MVLIMWKFPTKPWFLISLRGCFILGRDNSGEKLHTLNISEVTSSILYGAGLGFLDLNIYTRRVSRSIFPKEMIHIPKYNWK